jgi:hypothetical protein
MDMLVCTHGNGSKSRSCLLKAKNSHIRTQSEYNFQRFRTGAHNISLHLWDKTIKQEEPVVHYDEIVSHEKGVGEWTAKIVWFLHGYVK